MLSNVVRHCEADDIRELQKLAGQPPDCSVSQFDGLVAGGVPQDHFLLIMDCGKGKRILMLAHGKYPFPSDPKPTSYRILDSREIQVAEGGTLDLAAGACKKGRKVLLNTVAVNAVWSSRQRIASGSGLTEIFAPSADLNRLEKLADSQVSCFRDEP